MNSCPTLFSLLFLVYVSFKGHRGSAGRSGLNNSKRNLVLLLFLLLDRSERWFRFSVLTVLDRNRPILPSIV